MYIHIYIYIHICIYLFIYTPHRGGRERARRRAAPGKKMQGWVNPPVWHLLAFTRYCHYQYCIVYGI